VETLPVMAVVSSSLQYKGPLRLAFSPKMMHCSSQRSEYKTQYIIFQNVFVLPFAMKLSVKQSAKLTDPN